MNAIQKNRHPRIVLGFIVFLISFALLAGIVFKVKKKFEDLKPDQQQQAEKMGYRPGDIVELQISPAEKGDEVIIVIMPKPDTGTDGPPSPPQPQELTPVIKSKFNSEFDLMRSMGMGTQNKISVMGKSVKIIIGEMLGFGLYKGYALFDSLPQKVKPEALEMGYKSGDIVGFKVIDKNGTMLTKNVTIPKGQMDNLKGMALEMPIPWNNGEKLGRISAISQKNDIDWNPEFSFTLVSMDGKAEQTFPGYKLLDCKFRPDLKSEPIRDGNFPGKVVEIWCPWHEGQKVGVVTTFRNDAGRCLFTLKSLDGKEEKSFETRDCKEIKIVANSIEEYKQKN